MIEVIPYTSDKLNEALSLNVCKREVDELKALGREDIKQVLKESLECAGYAWYLKDHKGVRALGGVSFDMYYPETMGIVWLLVDEECFKEYLFTLNSLTYDLLNICFYELNLECVYNVVSPTINKPSVKWLKSIGFEISEHYKLGLDKKSEFKTFTMYKEDFKCAHQQ